ncbi:hypothetical protein L345_09942, partial [Ophiophagus hannah]
MWGKEDVFIDAEEGEGRLEDGVRMSRDASSRYLGSMIGSISWSRDASSRYLDSLIGSINRKPQEWPELLFFQMYCFRNGLDTLKSKFLPERSNHKKAEN